MASRDLGDLHPEVHQKCLLHIEACKAEGIDLLVYCTHRSVAEQNVLYAKGRKTPGDIVTNAPGGASKHNHTVDGKPASLAYDCIPLVGGKAGWGNSKLITRVGLLGEEVGLKWAGRWRGKLKESVHFEI